MFASRLQALGIATWLVVWLISLLLLERAGPRLAGRWRAHAARADGREAAGPPLRIVARFRTRIGVALVAACIALSFSRGLLPYAADEPNDWLVPALVMMGVGVGLRIAALGVIEKRRQLASRGIYSICRHPLYLGTIVMTFGVCLLFRQPWNMIAAWAYFFLLYPLTMAKEEFENELRFGPDFDAYRARTPLILPLGSWRPVHEFDWPRSLLKGGLVALASMAGALVAAQLMSDLMRNAPVS